MQSDNIFSSTIRTIICDTFETLRDKISVSTISLGSRIRAFDWYRPRWPWMTSSGVIALMLRFFTEFDCIAGQLHHSGRRQTYNVRKISQPKGLHHRGWWHLLLSLMAKWLWSVLCLVIVINVCDTVITAKTSTLNVAQSQMAQSLSNCYWFVVIIVVITIIYYYYYYLQQWLWG